MSEKTRFVKAWSVGQWRDISMKLHAEGLEVVSHFSNLTQYTFSNGNEEVVVDLMY